MRQRGELDVPSAVMITDFAVHSQWLHPGNDLHLCVSPDAAQQVRAALGRTAQVHAPGPVVPERFHKAAVAENAGRKPTSWPARLDAIGAGRPVVLVSTGSWGVASGLVDTATRMADNGYLPVLLCGRDERTRARLSRIPGVEAFGWIDDLDGRMAAASALIDNAAGQTAVQALAAGLPVVGYRPIAGHGRQGVARMAQIGVTEFARDADELVKALAWLTEAGNQAREARVRTGFDLFAGDAADCLERAAARLSPQTQQLP
jgi:UDP-N-acetylglucosamine:LPS N-acetylglucosamine transferase